MSRARNIKPGFFKNELLVELPFEYRLLFIGLWTMADRAGRFEDRPTKIRMELFPADSVDVDAGLQALHDAGFVLRYEVDGKRLVQVLAWDKHQNPHIKEAKSTLPAPVEHCASTVQAPADAHASPADSLIPDSLIQQPSTIAVPAAPPTDYEGRFEGHGDAKPAMPNPVTEFAIALNDLGFRATSLNPDLVSYQQAGGTVAHLVEIAMHPDCAGKNATYVARFAHRELKSVAKPITGNARAGPAPSKTLTAIQRLEGMKHGLANHRTADGIPEAPLLGAGSDPGH